jgi:MGT family glycosyltransferase
VTTTRPLRLLFTTIDGGGNVAPVIGVVAQLTQRGHSVRVMSETANQAEAKASGACFVPWRRAPNRPIRARETDPADWAAPTPLHGIQDMFEKFLCGCALLYAQDVMDELRREPADLVINFDMLFGVMTGCEALSQRLALLSTMSSMFPFPDTPPFGFALPPARTAAERVAIAKANETLIAMYDAGLPALNAARLTLGLAPLAHTLDQLNAASVRWLGTARAFDFVPEPLPSYVRYVGPLIRDPYTIPWVSPWRAEDPRPLVLVSFSTSFQNHATCLQRVIDACAGLPVRVLVTLGGSIRTHEVRAAENTIVVTSAPHSIVMREATIVVTHGGHGTVMTALINRLPLLVIPHGRDQGDNAVRVTERGAGLSVPNTAASEEIAAAIKRLLAEPAFAESARRLGDAVVAEVTSTPIVEEIESLARADTRTWRPDRDVGSRA